MNDPSGLEASGQQPSGEKPSGQHAMSRPVSRGVLSVFAADEQTDVEIDTARWRNLAEQVIREEGVMEPGVGSGAAGIGLSSVAQRLAAFYGETGRLRIASAPRIGTLVSVVVPVEREERS